MSTTSNVPQYKPARRKCLGGCDRMFNSSGPGNRVCPQCKRRRDEAIQGYEPIKAHPLDDEDET